MDFHLDEAQQQFQALIRRFANAEIKPIAREHEQGGIYPEKLVGQMAELGLFGMTIPESFGGLGLDSVAMAIVFEEISRAWMGAAGLLGTHSLACAMLNRFGTDLQKERYLFDLAQGVRRTAIGLTEPDAGSDLQGIRTTAVLRGDTYVVNGSKTWITNARYANPLPILVKTDPKADPRHRGMSILLVEQETPGYRVLKDIPKLGYKGPESCELVFEDAEVPAANLLGGAEGRGLQQALWALQLGRINVAARSVGLAQAALDAAVEYSQHRKAFGHAISSYQAIQLKLADMATSTQAARLLTYWAAQEVDREGRADRQSAMAKMFASENALRCSLESMRVHGGYGYSTEVEVERYYRDAPLLAIGEGTNEILHILIAESLLGDAHH